MAVSEFGDPTEKLYQGVIPPHVPTLTAHILARHGGDGLQLRIVLLLESDKGELNLLLEAEINVALVVVGELFDVVSEALVNLLGGFVETVVL